MLSNALPSPQPLTLRRRLQAETHDIHQELHVHPVFAPLQRDDITLDQYKAIIRAFRDFYTQQEPRYAGVSQRFAGEIAPLPLLERDAQYLSLPPVTPAETLPMLAADDLSGYAGYLYVKQGSTLGGQVISKHLEKILGLEKGMTLHFFNGTGADTGKTWKAFEAWLDAMTPYLDPDRVATSALAFFQSLKQHMSAIQKDAAHGR